MAGDETRRVLKLFGVAVTNLEEAIDRPAPVPEIMKWDAEGVALELPAPPRRIVSLIPSTTELLCALGLADALVGVTVYCVEPRDVVRGKTRVGGEKDPDLAAIRALAPDLVVANVEENRREDVAALRAAGIAVWVTYPRTVAEGLSGRPTRSSVSRAIRSTTTCASR